MRRHFASQSVEVVVERRRCERRGTSGSGLLDRRIAERRAAAFSATAPELPRRLRRYAAQLAFVAPLRPAAEYTEDIDTRRLIAAFQHGDRDAFTTLYTRNFDPIYRYLRLLLRDEHEAEDVTQEVFVTALHALDGFDVRRRTPFRGWLIRVARNRAIDQLRKHGRLELTEPEALVRHQEAAQPDDASVAWALQWMTDDELLLLIERLPPLHRQVIAMRFILGLDTHQIAEVLDRSAAAVRQAQCRALRSLELKLTSLGRQPVLSAAAQPYQGVLRQAPVLRRRRFALGLAGIR